MKEDFIENFKKNNDSFCQVCGDKLSDYAKISIRSTNTSKRYRGSGRPVISTYSILCCPECHKDIMGKISEVLINRYDNNK